MSQIKIQLIKEGIRYPNILSCSFFTMENSYRNFNKYKEQLKRFLKQAEVLKDYELRIYTDNTGKEYALEICESYSFVSIYLFDCPSFREGIGHQGTFGTLVRFLPLFEEHKLVWISDIDIPDNYLDIDLKGDIIINSALCYERKVYGRKYTILAGRFISKKKLPKRLLTKFINDILEGKYSNEINELNKQNTRKPSSNFPYGMDELFLNWIIYDWLQKQEFKINIHIDMLITNILIKNIDITLESKKILEDYYWKPEKKQITKIKKIYLEYIPKILKKFPCLQVALDSIHTLKNSLIQSFFIKSSDL